MVHQKVLSRSSNELNTQFQQSTPEQVVVFIFKPTCLISPNLTSEFVGPAKHKFTLQQCTGKVYVTPDITLNKCARKQEKGKFSANVSLVTESGMGCDRETFEGSDMFTLCGASNFIDLLPKPGVGREWTENIAKKNEKGRFILKLETAFKQF